MKTLNEQAELISRFLHCTTEPFDDWSWNGVCLEIYLKEKIIEQYLYKDLKKIIPEL